MLVTFLAGVLGNFLNKSAKTAYYSPKTMQKYAMDA
jgi:hypothetical protein